jgi:hypothetical protein
MSSVDVAVAQAVKERKAGHYRGALELLKGVVAALRRRPKRSR